MRIFMQHNWCIGSCKIFRKSCLCASPPSRANGKRGICSRAPSMDTQRCSLPCCGSEGVPADGAASPLTVFHLKSCWSLDWSLPSEIAPGVPAIGRARFCLPPTRILCKCGLCKDTISRDLYLPLETTLWMQTFLPIWLLMVVCPWNGENCLAHCTLCLSSELCISAPR